MLTKSISQYNAAIIKADNNKKQHDDANTESSLFPNDSNKAIAIRDYADMQKVLENGLNSVYTDMREFKRLPIIDSEEERRVLIDIRKNRNDLNEIINKAIKSNPNLAKILQLKTVSRYSWHDDMKIFNKITAAVNYCAKTIKDDVSISKKSFLGTISEHVEINYKKETISLNKLLSKYHTGLNIKKTQVIEKSVTQKRLTSLLNPVAKEKEATIYKAKISTTMALLTAELIKFSSKFDKMSIELKQMINSHDPITLENTKEYFGELSNLIKFMTKKIIHNTRSKSNKYDFIYPDLFEQFRASYLSFLDMSASRNMLNSYIYVVLKSDNITLEQISKISEHLRVEKEMAFTNRASGVFDTDSLDLSKEEITSMSNLFEKITIGYRACLEKDIELLKNMENQANKITN